MPYQTLRYEQADRIATITFATPDRLNAITEQRLDEFEHVLDALQQDTQTRALIVTGEGRAFCVGLDLDLLERAFDDIAYFEHTVRRLAAIIARLEDLPIPTIAAVNGYARAGGFETTLGLDFMIIAEDARIGDAHTDAGVVPACVTLRLARRIGVQRAKELLFTARWLTGAEAVTYGLALKAVPLTELIPQTRAFAATLTDKPPAALRSLKALFRVGAGLGVADGAEIELQSFVRYMSSEPWGREGYRAFREHRPPAWRGVMPI
jgi:enoyl-CoA hydratase/carnithine racemase